MLLRKEGTTIKYRTQGRRHGAAETVTRLADIGKWLQANGEAIYATNARQEYKEGG